MEIGSPLSCTYIPKRLILPSFTLLKMDLYPYAGLFDSFIVWARRSMYSAAGIAIIASSQMGSGPLEKKNLQTMNLLGMQSGCSQAPPQAYERPLIDYPDLLSGLTSMYLPQTLIQHQLRLYHWLLSTPEGEECGCCSLGFVESPGSFRRKVKDLVS